MDAKDKEILRECLKVQGQNDITLDSFKKLFSYLKDSDDIEPKTHASTNAGTVAQHPGSHQKDA